MKAISFLFLALLPFTLSLPALSSRQTDLETITDELLFSVSIHTFEARRNALDPPELNWSSDGCTAAPNDPLGFNFLPPCHRHDFGYRNYKAQSRFTGANKAKIDSNFKQDMDNQCATEKLLERDACKAFAEAYYEAVKLVGSKKERSVEIRA